MCHSRINGRKHLIANSDFASHFLVFAKTAEQEASSLGTAEYALDLSVKRAQERVTSKKPSAERQAIQRYLAEMAADVYALKLMLQDVAARWDRGERIPAQAPMTKLFGLEAAGLISRSARTQAASGTRRSCRQAPSPRRASPPALQQARAPLRSRG